MSEPEVPAAERDEALVKARGHWLLALVELEQPSRRPGLVLIGGLPGTGKSTLAAELAARAGLTLVRSDVVRKELARAAGIGETSAAFGQGIYSHSWNERTYAECLRRAEQELFEGRRVVIDASFREEAPRRAFMESAARWDVPAILLLCQAEASFVQERLAGRRGDASDADWAIYLQAAEAWEPPSDATAASRRTIQTDDLSNPAIEQALAALQDVGLRE